MLLFDGAAESSKCNTTPRLSGAVTLEIDAMDKNRVEGSAMQVKGEVKKALGKAVGDAKLKSDGEADVAAGKIQNAIGGLVDTLKGK